MDAEEGKPKLVVFDLDYTLWPFWVDTHVEPPFRKAKNGKVYDSCNHVIKLYPDVLEILQHLKAENYQIAVASRTGCISEAESLLHLFDLNHFFSMKQIYPGSKISHFSHFHKVSKVPYEDMVFFDDEERNIIELSRIGVTCHYITNGMRWKDWHEGLEKHKKKQRRLTSLSGIKDRCLLNVDRSNDILHEKVASFLPPNYSQTLWVCGREHLSSPYGSFHLPNRMQQSKQLLNFPNTKTFESLLPHIWL